MIDIICYNALSTVWRQLHRTRSPSDTLTPARRGEAEAGGKMRMGGKTMADLRGKMRAGLRDRTSMRVDGKTRAGLRSKTSARLAPNMSVI
jgi:hypothetical protein